MTAALLLQLEFEGRLDHADADAEVAGGDEALASTAAELEVSELQMHERGRQAATPIYSAPHYPALPLVWAQSEAWLLDRCPEFCMELPIADTDVNVSGMRQAGGSGQDSGEGAKSGMAVSCK